MEASFWCGAIAGEGYLGDVRIIGGWARGWRCAGEVPRKTPLPFSRPASTAQEGRSTCILAHFEQDEGVEQECVEVTEETEIDEGRYDAISNSEAQLGRSANAANELSHGRNTD